jgi:hypothetical protein
MPQFNIATPQAQPPTQGAPQSQNHGALQAFLELIQRMYRYAPEEKLQPPGGITGVRG